MPIHLSTADKLNVAWRQLAAKLFARNPAVADATYQQRLEARLDTRKGQRVTPINNYANWKTTFAQCPNYLDQASWKGEFEENGGLDWIVNQAFQHNQGLRIDLIFFGLDKEKLKRVEAVVNNNANVLWSDPRNGSTAWPGAERRRNA
jgi:hypothetical protein